MDKERPRSSEYRESWFIVLSLRQVLKRYKRLDFYLLMPAGRLISFLLTLTLPSTNTGKGGTRAVSQGGEDVRGEKMGIWGGISVCS